jgi:DNA polymerase-4
MDAFFAAVEVLDDPSLRGKPVIVGGTPEGRGVVSTASYEAREFGVHSAMPAGTARRLCPQGIFVRPRMRRYVEMSRKIFAVFAEYTPLVEGLSIDEAFLDITGCRAFATRRAPESAVDVDTAVALGKELQARITSETGGLTCSVGLARNKFLAKLASDLQKPSGLTVVPRDDVEAFLAPLPIERMWGVGPRTAEHLRKIGIQIVADLQRVAPDDLKRMLGEEAGGHLSALARGHDERPVITDRRAKSISQERTFGDFIPPDDIDAIESELFSMSDQVATRLRDAGLWGRAVHLKVRDETFDTKTRSRALESSTCLVEEIYGTARAMFRERIRLGGRKVRLLGVGVSKLTTEPKRQLDIFTPKEWEKASSLAAAVDAVKAKLGEKAITRGRLMRDGNREAKGE